MSPSSKQPSDTPQYLAPYREATDDLGPTFGALLWKNERAQSLRFAAAATAGLTGRSIADLGCGRADLALFLHAHSIQYGRYLGLEGIAELRAAAQDLIDEHSLPEAGTQDADFVADDKLFKTLVKKQRIDTFIFSGSLNTLTQNQTEQVLDRAWDALETGGLLIFNYLTDRTDPDRRGQPTGPANRFDTLRLVGWALDRTHLASFRQDYLEGHDATITMRKPSNHRDY